MRGVGERVVVLVSGHGLLRVELGEDHSLGLVGAEEHCGLGLAAAF